MAEVRRQLELQDVQSYRHIVTTNKPTPQTVQAGCPSCRPTNNVKALNGKPYLSELGHGCTLDNKS